MRELEDIRSSTAGIPIPHKNSSGPQAEDRIPVDIITVGTTMNRDNVWTILPYNKSFDPGSNEMDLLKKRILWEMKMWKMNMTMIVSMK